MATLSADTHPEAEQIQIMLIRKTPVWRKLMMVGEMNRTLWTLAWSGLRTRHPTAGEAELKRRMADLWLGPDLALRVYGPLEIGDQCDDGS